VNDTTVEVAGVVAERVRREVPAQVVAGRDRVAEDAKIDGLPAAGCVQEGYLVPRRRGDGGEDEEHHRRERDCAKRLDACRRGNMT
jgi:hypothetical protein